MRLRLVNALLLATCLAAPAAEGGPVISIDPGLDRGPVNRLVLGHNIEAGNGKDIFGSKTDTNDPRAGRGAWDVAARQPVADTVAWSKAIGMGMLRYPGGCLTHNFDWKLAVGPIAERPYYTFGIDEYLTFCRAAGAEPLMNVSELAAPGDAAALVEYLNAPADAAHPWAAKRAAWGHPEPWGVRWFEMANESDHGNHDVQPPLRRNAGEYADWVVACSAAMRRVDAGIRIGAHMGTGTPVDDPWNAVVLDAAGKQLDFIAVHTYAVGSPAPTDDPELVGRACMAATAQIGALLGSYHDLIRARVGHDIPLAVTEYNAGFSAPEKPWRYSFAAALHSGDQVRLMLEPEAGVAMANYWQFLNGYWGFLRGPEVPPGDVRWKTTAAAPVFRLWGGHLGTRLLGCTASAVPRLEFAGFKHAFPARGDAWVEPTELSQRQLPIAAASARGYSVVVGEPGAAEVACSGLGGKHYHDLPSFPVHGGNTYRLTWEQRVEDGGDLKPGLGLCDARGWEATHSACGSNSGVRLADGWTACQADLATLRDATALVGVIRLEGGQPSNARIAIRKATVREMTPRTAPAFPALTALASLAADGRTVHLVVFNKHHADALTAAIRLADASAVSARAWSVTGPFAATNLDKEEVREVLGGAAVAGVAGAGFSFTFPPHSMSAIDIAR